jgi:hypothetical protein
MGEEVQALYRKGSLFVQRLFCRCKYPKLIKIVIGYLEKSEQSHLVEWREGKLKIGLQNKVFKIEKSR